MYELTNHLGNVQVVITDKRLYDAEIATDQNDVPVKLDYENYLSTWSAQTPGACTTPAQFSINNSKLQIDFPPFVNPCAGNSADYKINTVTGETYTVSIQAERGVATDVIAIETRDHINNTVIPTAVWGTNIQPGVVEPCIEFTFTATSAETRLKIFSRSDAYVDPTVLYIDEMQILAYERIVADVVSFSDYYPFGWEMPSRNGGSADYRYGFQAQEKDDEIKGEGNSINYRYRGYDPRTARFYAVDPLSAKYPEWTPYQFDGNMPTRYIELEGLEPGGDGTTGGQYEIAKKEGTDDDYGWTWTEGEDGTFSWVQGECTAYTDGRNAWANSADDDLGKTHHSGIGPDQYNAQGEQHHLNSFYWSFMGGSMLGGNFSKEKAILYNRFL